MQTTNNEFVPSRPLVTIWILFLSIFEIRAAIHCTIKRFHHRSLQSSSSSPLPASYIAKLTAEDGGLYQHFGDVNQVSVSNNRIVVGAYGHDGYQGAAFVFGDPNDPQNGHQYSQLAILTASDGESRLFW
jgi:hypothetical protein